MAESPIASKSFALQSLIIVNPITALSLIFRAVAINNSRLDEILPCSLRGSGIRSRLARDEPREELEELAGGGYGETVLIECFGKLSPGKPVLLRVVEETPKQRVNDVFF
jgi:hypothetical protein